MIIIMVMELVLFKVIMLDIYKGWFIVNYKITHMHMPLSLIL
jgi:hypothetical protein